ncbi:EF hand domain protein [Xylariales sp. AK1849]|nr:EF hand domain protein [Xylariales sp. AK1849]
MSSSSAAAATLTRPRLAVAIVSAITAASAGYYFYQYRLSLSDAEGIPGPGLHRSNAVRRNRRQSLHQEDDSERDENVDTNSALVPLAEVAVGAQDDDDDWYNDLGPTSQSRQRTGENIVTLLFRVSEDNARRNAYVHRGCQCNGCGMVPIRGIRYRCANCADFDLCEVCESQGLHNKTHVFYKVRIPAPPFCPRQVQPAWYPGDPDNSVHSLPRYLLSKWSHETGFERVELEAYWEQWTFIANTEWRDDPDGLCLAMDRKTFERCLVPSGGYRHAAPNLIHDRMFAFYDSNKDGLIGFEEFLHGVSYRKRQDKLKRTFEGYDIDSDGHVSRKDFLHMFRAYYVLYKQMHRDILEGLDEHMMTTTDAQQLVNSRAPLSSLFGREGRVPAADHSRPMEGKIFRSNGEVDIRDGKASAVNEDKPDTENREEILSGLFARNHNRSLFTESFGSSRQSRSPSGESRYLQGIINPPQTMVDLSSLINGDYTQLDDIIASIRNDEAVNRSLPGDDDNESDSPSSDEEDQATPEDNMGNASAADTQVDTHGAATSSRQLAVPDASRITNRLPTESELRAQHQAIVANTHRLGLDKRKRVQARRQLHERWKRRQFYLDEEEGASPPQGWDGDEDVLVNLNGVAESSKSAPQMLSPRSRSSSKVRFAEDTDDFDIRSNPSTSSRSVPERWGGMEIPDAERDAGKEILYQVTQQAFNELLDVIFKKKEDLAVRCAETTAERNNYRHLFEHINLSKGSTTPPDRPIRPENDERSREQSLERLLSASGYSISQQPEEDELPCLVPIADSQHAGTASRANDDAEDDDTSTEQRPASATGPSVAADVAYRDPTMPQFRPHSDGEMKQDGPSDGAVETDHVPEHTVDDEEDISQSSLEEWKMLDNAEEEARVRGGWGKLSFEEFEKIYKEHEFHDSSRNRLDYLGSWIDFCIP